MYVQNTTNLPSFNTTPRQSHSAEQTKQIFLYTQAANGIKQGTFCG